MLQQVTEPISIDEFQGWRSVARCLSSRFCREGAGRDQEPLIAASGHRSTKVPDRTHRDASAIPLTLNEHWAVPALNLILVSPAEGKIVKNRLRLDVNPTDREQDEEVRRLLDLGARRADVGQGDESWVVLADPEGNEFCVLAGRRP